WKDSKPADWRVPLRGDAQSSRYRSLQPHRRLFQRGGDIGEGGRQIGADGGDAGNDDNRDQSSDQAILDGGGTGFILAEAEQNLAHDGYPIEIAPTVPGKNFREAYGDH